MRVFLLYFGLTYCPFAAHLTYRDFSQVAAGGVQTCILPQINFIFEHKTADKSAARKIEAPVRFPASLNMAPYTTLVMHKQEQLKENGTASSSLVP